VLGRVLGIEYPVSKTAVSVDLETRYDTTDWTDLTRLDGPSSPPLIPTPSSPTRYPAPFHTPLSPSQLPPLLPLRRPFPLPSSSHSQVLIAIYMMGLLVQFSLMTDSVQYPLNATSDVG